MSADLDEAERLHAATTPGPWKKDRNWCITGPRHDWGRLWNGRYMSGDHDERILQIAGPGALNRARGDQDFILAAHAQWPALIAELRTLREFVRDAIENDDSRCPFCGRKSGHHSSCTCGGK